MRAADARAELLQLLEVEAAGAVAPQGMEPAPPTPVPVSRGPLPAFPIDRAALLLAVDEYPELDLAACEGLLNGYAGQVAGRVSGSGPAGPSPLAGVAALRQVLYEDEGFHGNREQYYDVRNSYLNEVLDRKLGIPISLAAVVLGVARRLEWPLRGVSFPNHFLVVWEGGEDPPALDPFDGLVLGREELEERWRRGTGTEPPGVSGMLAPASPRAILIRMLNNIRLVHTIRGELRRAAIAAEKMALVALPRRGAVER